MSNTILTPNIIANEALDVLRTNAVMANLVHRDYSSEFVAGVGDTITVRKPATFEAKEFTTEVEVQDATEGKVPVKMDKLLDVTFAVTSKELTMGIVDFSAQFLVPAMQAFADKIDGYLLALEKDVTNRVDHTKGAIAVADIIAARKFLVDAKAPSTERRFVYGSQAEATCSTPRRSPTPPPSATTVPPSRRHRLAASTASTSTATRTCRRPRRRRQTTRRPSRSTRTPSRS